MKTGDLEPTWQIAVTTDVETDLDLVSSWRIVASLNDVVLFTDTAPVVMVDPESTNSAVLEHTWVAGETDDSGLVIAEVVAVWPNGNEQTFPSDNSYATLRLWPSLD